MSLPVLKIIWSGNDSSGNHWNHLHVEGIPKQTGTPPLSNPGMTDSVWAIYVALSERFGQPAYMSGGDWNHMGWYNRRYIGGTTIWSQHSWSNAIDIGPYYGVAQQQKFYDFLTGKEEDMASSAQKMMVDLAFNLFPAEVQGDPNYWYNLDEGSSEWNTGFRPALSRGAANLAARVGGQGISPAEAEAIAKTVVKGSKIQPS
jgi:hypothetical protein